MPGIYSKENEKRRAIGRLEIVDAASNDEHGEGNGSWTTLLHVLLPLAALTLLWGRKGFITKFFLQFKENYISALCPSFDKHPQFIKWIDDRLKYTWASQLTHLGGRIADYWKNGSLLCLLINAAIPGSCSNPQKHWKQRPCHGQHLAYKYLGVTPIFTEEDFTYEYLTAKKEYQFFKYLVEVKKLVEKISRRDIKYSSRYVAKGMGLITGELFKKSTFYIYKNYSMETNKTDVVVSITGPYGTHCSTTISSIYVKKQTELQRLAYVSRAQKLFFRSFSLDLGSIINTDQKEVSLDDIPIKFVTEKERVKIVFIPQIVGMHEISIVTNGFHLVGSPFLANILPQSSLLSETFAKDVENNTTKDSYKCTKKKIISKIIDCIDEQIILYSTSSMSCTELDTKTLEHNVEIQILSEKGDQPLPALDFGHSSQTLEVIKNTERSTSGKEHVDIDDTDYCSNDLQCVSNEETAAFIDAYGVYNLSQDTSIETCLEENRVTEKFVDNPKPSPICKSHIDREVTGDTVELSLDIPQAAEKKLLTRQYGIDVREERLVSTNLSNCKNVDTTFEKLVKRDGYYEKRTAYVDSYLTKLELQSDVLSPNDCSTILKLKHIGQYSYPNHTEPNYLSEPIPKTRRSLPNILATSNCNLGLDVRNKTYKERQEYWKKLSSQTPSCSSISSGQSYSLIAFEYGSKTARSLPNLSDLREAILNESNSRCDTFVDFYGSCQADSFRNKFLQCKDYWETLSRQNLTVSIDMVNENDLDSGYYASLPNLSPDINESKQSKQFQEKRQFWENLSLDNSKWGQLQAKKNYRSRKILHSGKISLGKKLATNKHIIREDEDEEILKKRDEANLTDDLKQMGHVQYVQARNFFKSLEEVGS